VRYHADHCIYFNPTTRVSIAGWMDDLIILIKTVEIINSVKKNPTSEFELKDLREL
jgi:hypothetical protein